MKRTRLIVLLGPTAVGKTELSIRLAQHHLAEIISGDSMQVYCGMDIGTAKISESERAGIPHHMIDVVHPSHPFTVAQFQALTRSCIDQVTARGRLPMLVGGTGLYIESLCYGFNFSRTESDPQFRKQMDDFADVHGNEALHAKLQVVDAITAARLHPNDRRRVIRALEIRALSGQSMSRQAGKEAADAHYQLCLIGLRRTREDLYRRIDWRVEQMIADGLVDEVRNLLHSGVEVTMTSMQGLGYKEMASYLHGQLSFEEAVHLVKQRTRQFAKRQMSWFRHMADIEWMDLPAEQSALVQFEKINDIISKKLEFA